MDDEFYQVLLAFKVKLCCKQKKKKKNSNEIIRKTSLKLESKSCPAVTRLVYGSCLSVAAT